MPALAKFPALVLVSCLTRVVSFSGRSYPGPPSRYPVGYDPDNRSRPAWHPDAHRYYAAFPAEEILLPKPQLPKPQYPPLPRPWRPCSRNTSTPSPPPDSDSPSRSSLRPSPRWEPPQGYVPRSRPPTPRPSPRWEPPQGYSPERNRERDAYNPHKPHNPHRPPTLQRTTHGPDAEPPVWNEYISPGGCADSEVSPPEATPCPTDAVDPCALAGCTPDDGRIHLCTGIWMGRKILQRRCLRLDP